MRLLGRFDPLLLAHRDKDWVVPAKYYNRVWRPAGHIEGVVLESGPGRGNLALRPDRHRQIGRAGVSRSGRGCRCA